MKLPNKVFYITPYYPPNLGGMQKCAQIIAEYFSSHGYEVTVLTSDCNVKRKRTNSEHLIIKYLKSFEFANTPFAFSLIKELLMISKNDIVHIHIANAFFPELVYIISKVKGYRYIAHVHIDVEGSGIMAFLLPLYKSICLSRVLKSAQKIICLTPSFKVLLTKKYKIPESKLIVIPNGVDSKYFISQNKNNSKPYNLLFVGRLSPQKNLPMLISSIKKVKTQVVLNIVGEGYERKKLEQIAADLNLRNVIFHGENDSDQLIGFYKNAIIFILPSENEGMSLAMLEAMAAGLPIIGIKIPQTEDFIKEGALLIDNPNSTKLAGAIDELLINKAKIKSMGDYNKSVAKSYTWNSSLKKIATIYHDLSL